jgi:DmsE family decaheme c-type cytochrome
MTRGIRFEIQLVCLLTALGIASLTSAHAQGNPAVTSGSAHKYAPADACKTCHEELYVGWEKSQHWKTTLDKSGDPSKMGCQGCHGPAATHVEDPSNKTELFIFKDHSPKEINARCMSCHAGGTQHMNAINSVHAQNGVSCTDCHSPHHAETKEFLLAKPETQLCFSCHLAQKGQFNMPFRHRVLEGLIQCNDCHNPHGTVLPKQLRMSPEQSAVCFKCHADVQGPFVFEHDPVKAEGCTSCHVPHGGPNQHMLLYSTVNLLCLTCHTNSTFSGALSTPSFHDQSAKYQACTLCHTKIHGSNFSNDFFK